MSALTEKVARGCKVPGCAGSQHAHGYCGSHYQRLRRYGSPGGAPAEPPSMTERFRSQVVASEDGCWQWVGALDSNGYGSFWTGRPAGNRTAHRVGWELARGPVPEGLELDHLCRNRACVNPDHLEPVTHAENVRRSAAGYGAREMCKSGLHSIREPQNVYTNTNGTRRCRACTLQGIKRRRDADPDARAKEQQREARYRAERAVRANVAAEIRALDDGEPRSPGALNAIDDAARIAEGKQP